MVSERFGYEIRKPGWSLGMQNWENTYDTKESAERGFRHISDFLADHGVVLDHASAILEVGSGKGYLLQVMKERHLNVVGVDARPRGVERERLVGARAEELPFGDETFSVVISLSAFDSAVYEQKQQMMIGEITRVLKRGGAFLNIGSSLDSGTKPESFGLSLVSDPADASWRSLYRKKK